MEKSWELSAAFHKYAYESVRPEPVEGPVTSAGSVRSLSEVEGLTTNGYVTVILKRITKAA